jgi:diguanylate cyclase (GGDEF)-like protein/PAS domain S-box-containing protein
MAYFILSIFIYLCPAAVLFYMGLEIYFRDKSHILNKVTALLMFMLMTIIVGLLLTNAFPAEYFIALHFYFIYIPAFLIMALVLHFSLRLTSRFNKVSRLRMLLLCYFPTLPILLIFFPPYWFTITYSSEGPWKFAQPSVGLFVITQFMVLYIVIVSTYLIIAGLRFVSKHPNFHQQKRQIHFILLAILLAGCWVIITMFFRGNLFISQLKPPELSTFSIVIFAIFVRVAMTKHSFLPPIERKYQVLYELSPLAIVLLDQEAKIHDANPSALQLFDLSLIEIRQRSFPSFLVTVDRKSFLRQFEGSLSGAKIGSQEYSIIKNTLEQRLVQAESELIFINGYQYQYVILRDITESRLAEQRITFLAYHDPLTGLANRSKFQQQLIEALLPLREEKGQIAVLMMDLDRFKLINDTKGHHVGDLLLRHVANQLMKQAPEQMKIARLGGDEFTMFITGIESEDQVHHFARQILQALRDPFIFEDTPFYITASLGICLSPQFGDSADTLLKYADIAMYYAKNNGRDRYQIYNHQLKHPE